MTEGETSESDESRFSTKKVDAPIVNPDGTEKLDQRVRPGVNVDPGNPSESSGAEANVDDPLESSRSNVPPAYRDSVKSYFSPETD